MTKLPEQALSNRGASLSEIHRIHAGTLLQPSAQVETQSHQCRTKKNSECKLLITDLNHGPTSTWHGCIGIHGQQQALRKQVEVSSNSQILDENFTNMNIFSNATLPFQ